MLEVKQTTEFTIMWSIQNRNSWSKYSRIFSEEMDEITRDFGLTHSIRCIFITKVANFAQRTLGNSAGGLSEIFLYLWSKDIGSVGQSQCFYSLFCFVPYQKLILQSKADVYVR